MRIYGGTFDEDAVQVQPTPDGGYIALGNTQTFGKGAEDFYLVKFDGQGVKEWEQEYGTPNNDAAVALAQTADGYVLLGSTLGFGYTVPAFYLVKTDLVGSTMWAKHFTSDGGTVSEQPSALLPLADGGYLISGWESRDGKVNMPCFVRTDPTGNLLWQHAYPDTPYSADTRINGVVRKPDGGFVAVGSRVSGGDHLIVFLETDSIGGNAKMNLIKPSSTKGEGFGIDLDPDGYVSYGYTTPTSGASTLFVNPQFTFSNGPATGDTASRFAAGHRTSDGGTIAIGTGISLTNGSRDIVLMKTDASKNQQWIRMFGGSSTDLGVSVAPTPDGGYIMLGTTDSPHARIGRDIMLIKVDADGNLCN